MTIYQVEKLFTCCLYALKFWAQNFDFRITNLIQKLTLIIESTTHGAEPRGIQRNVLFYEKPAVFQTFPHITPR